jgi:hypothetical protein
MKKLILSAVLFVFSTSSYAGAKPIPTEPDALAQKLNKTGLFVKFDPVPLSITPSKNEPLYLFKGESYEQKYGQYGSLRIELKKYIVPPLFQGFMFKAANEYIVLSDDARLLSSEKLLKQALKVRKEIWPNFVESSFTSPRLLRERREMNEAFLWHSFDKECKKYRTAYVLLRRVDGKCIAADVSEWKTFAETEQAFNKAKNAVYADSQFRQIEVLEWAIPPNRMAFCDSTVHPSQQVFQFQVQMKGKPKVVAVTLVSPDSKPQIEILDYPKILSKLDGALYNSGEHQTSEKPVWTRQGLVYESVDFSQKMEKGRRQPLSNRKLMLRDHQGKTSILYSNLDLESKPSIRFASTWSDSLIFTDINQFYRLNLKSGELKPISYGNDYLYFSQPFLNPDLAVYISVRTKMAKSEQEVGLQSKNVRETRTEILPIHSRYFGINAASSLMLGYQKFDILVDAEGKNYFAILTKNDTKLGNGKTSIRRLSQDKLLRLLESESPDLNQLIDTEEIHSISHKANSINFYPDSEKILYKAGNCQWMVADMKTHESKPVILPSLIERVVHVWPGRTADEITIVGSLRQGANRIFVSRIDGTGLEQLTPEVHAFAQFYRFESGKTGFDVSKAVGQFQIDELSHLWNRTKNKMTISDLLSGKALEPLE